jgi:phospholipid/cholesterol/gamma-HCH transport system substrate-binding protein
MELRYRREALVGMLLIVGATVFVLLMMWLRGKTFREGQAVHVVFNDVAGLKVGDPVRTSGVQVGTVRRIGLASPGNVDVWFDVGAGPTPREDASARILSADLFGARYVEYSPGVSRRPLPAGHDVRGVRVQDMSELAAALGDRAKAMLDTTTVTATAVSRELRITLQSAQTLMATLNSGSDAAFGQLVGSLEELRRSLQRIDLLVAQNGPVATDALRSVQATSARADTLMRSLARTSVQLDSLLTRAGHGRGPLPVLLNDSTIVTELMLTNTALRELLVDFKANPGRYIKFRL